MELNEHIRSAWGWTGLSPSAVVGENDFGNLIVRDEDGRYWRICPEDLYCHVIAESKADLDELSQSQDFLADWYMYGLISQAQAKLGPLPTDRKYCLKVPGPLGGEYGGDNLATIAFIELILASGHIAKQISDLPEGSNVRLQITG
jgi:hypothetical protein